MGSFSAKKCASRPENRDIGISATGIVASGEPVEQWSIPLGSYRLDFDTFWQDHPEILVMVLRLLCRIFRKERLKSVSVAFFIVLGYP
jgi:hypothetical protein